MPRQRLIALLTTILLAVPIVLSSRVSAQDSQLEYIPETVSDLQDIYDVGWDYVLRIGLSTAFANSSAVIGKLDGTTWTIGFNLEGAINYMRNYHEVRNSLQVIETFTRTPLIDEFVKSGDMLEFESIYFYHIPALPWVGPFARVRLATSLFEGMDVRPVEVAYLITRPDGEQETTVSDRLRTTDPFSPLILKASAGLFVRPLREEAIHLEVLLGFGFRQIFADDQLALQDDDETVEIEILQLESFAQAGGEATLSIWGQVAEERVNYQAGVEVMMPFLNDLAADDERSLVELTNIDINAGLTFRLVEWASLVYQLRMLREPQLLDEFQIQNNLLLSIGYTLFETPSAE